MTRNLLITVVAIIVLTLGSVYWYKHTQSNTTPPIATSTPTSTSMGITSKPVVAPVAATTTTSTADHPGMKLYRNDQWGFEFWYPERWEWQANVFGSPFSKFNLTVMKIDGKYTNQDDIINVVTPDFAIREYQDIKNKATPFTVDGVKGFKYIYQEDANYMDVVVPVNKDITIIFGNEDEAHIAEFNQVISSFKFLK